MTERGSYLPPAGESAGDGALLEPFECPEAAIAPPAPMRARTATAVTAIRRVMVTCICSLLSSMTRPTMGPQRERHVGLDHRRLGIRDTIRETRERLVTRSCQ